MIENLKYAVTFPNNGVSLSGELSFQPGVTAVTGKNGQGKTFAANEMVRYMLFGKRALRGPASDYKSLEGNMVVSIGDDRLTIARGKKESITDESGKIIAVKAEAVTAEIVKRLGFDLDVFDIVCAARQKESERLTKLRPAERKEMIDNIVGLRQNEAVEELCRKEAKQLRRDASTLAETIVVAVEPVKPDAYRKSEDLFEELRAARVVEDRRRELDRIIAAVGPAPEAPFQARYDTVSLEESEQRRLAEKARLDGMRAQMEAIPDADLSAEDLNRIEAWVDYQDEKDRRGPLPVLTIEQIDEMEAQWDLLDRKGDDVVCPACSHEFNVGGEMPEQPTLARPALRQERQRATNWSSALAVPLGEPEFLTRREISTGRLALEKQVEKLQIKVYLEGLAVEVGREEELRLARLIDAQWDAYEPSLAKWNIRNDAAAAAVAELGTLPASVDVAALNAAYTEARVYETQQEAYVVAKTRADATTEAIAEKLAKAEGFKAGGDALQRSRATFKAFLAPSLGKVASALISQMTDNKFNSVVIDEEMNIAVNGQEVSTMSGAQATIANLALRLALGQVLTAKVFPVFLGDEIDSDCDEEWGPLVAQALGKLKSQLKQIILISHKGFDWADQHIQIGESSELLLN